MPKTITAAIIAIIAAAALFIPSGNPTSAAVDSDPVVFVHGYTSNSAAWDTMIDRFKADGYANDQLFAFTYPSNISNTQIAIYVHLVVYIVRWYTGAEQVDIVAHSMGSLSSRHYLKNYGGDAWVDDWVSLGGPNHGTDLASICFFLNPCNEMIPTSPFITNLNSGDETPGAVNYGTWWSPCDELVIPQTNTILAGATNTQTTCLSHGQLRTDLTVYQQVRDFVQ